MPPRKHVQYLLLPVVSDIEVELAGSLLPLQLPDPPTGEDRNAAIRSSLQVLELAPNMITFPLLCTVYRAVLGPCSFSVHLVGQTGTFKTELAALAQQHFGSGFHAKNLPGACSSTGNALERLAFTAKDALLVVDDFAPCGSRYDVQRYHREADRLIRAQGNRAGRQRMRADTTLHPAKPPRGLILSTGEDTPQGHSARARMFIIEVGPNDVDVEVLTKCQQDAGLGLYVQSMAAFLQWLAPQYDQLQGEIEARRNDLRQEATRWDQHRRTPEIVADLALGPSYFLAFARQAGVITEEEQKTLWNRCWMALGQTAEAQNAHHAASDPVRRYFELLRSAIASGNAHVANPQGEEPREPQAWGWRRKTIGTGQIARDEWQAQGDRVGWVDEDNLYLDPDASYKVAQEMGGGNTLPVTPQTLRKRLDDRGLLLSSEKKSRGTLVIRVTLEGTRRPVVRVHRRLVFPPAQETDQTDHVPGSLPSDAGSGQFSRSVSPDGAADNRPGNLTRNAPTDPETPVGAVAGQVGQFPAHSREASEREVFDL